MHKTLTALALQAETTADARRAFAQYAGQADIIELRLDLMREHNLRELLENRPCPVIVTNRPVWEGGKCTVDDCIRIDVLLEAAELGAEYIDCEYAARQHIAGRDLGEAKLILSVHDMEKTPPLAPLCGQCREAGADIPKVVGTAQSIFDACKAVVALAESPPPAIALVMGRQGLPSRLMALRYGAFLTFASADSPNSATASGQLTLTAMREVYAAHLIDHQTSMFGYLTKEAPSAKLIAAANRDLREAGLNAVAVPLELADERPAEVIKAYEAAGFSGFASHYSLAAEDAPDELEDLVARVIGGSA